MFKLILITLALMCLNELAYSNIQLLAHREESHAFPKVGKSSSNLRNSIALNNGLSEEDTSGHDVLSESQDALANSPASMLRTRTKPSSISSSISSSSGLSRSSLIISASAHASATASAAPSSAASLQSSSPRASARSSTTIQHRLLPAETIPLPITISTRPGLRTVIAPETITIQQPTITKIGERVQNIPTAVSHQRQTVVHNHARVVTPIVAPGVRKVTSQVVRAYHTPLVYAPHISTINVADN